MHITGTVTTGKGEGHAYMSRPGYRQQFQQHFDMQPFPGTLNLKLEGENIERFKALQEQSGIHLSGFREDSQTYGAVRCYPCQVNDAVQAVIVIPDKSVYREVMEVVSDVCLREVLNLHDGDSVTVEIPAEG